MKWQFIDTGFNPGKFNMEFDINLAQNIKSDEAVLRLYRWQPYCISLGANQNFESVNLNKAAEDKIDVVKRPTGGRAILHSEELTYSVILPVAENLSAKNIYKEINLALLKGLKIYNPMLDEVNLENDQPAFSEFYKTDKSNICFAVSARSELKYKNKKLVGSAQRKFGNTILQHGSILCGTYHLNILEYLNLNKENIETLKAEISDSTSDLKSILNEEINYAELSSAIIKGFEINFEANFKESLTPELENTMQ